MSKKLTLAVSSHFLVYCSASTSHVLKSRTVCTSGTVNRGYFAQRGYSAQSVFPLLGLHKLIVSQTWALKLFQY